jgi:hypothetical protein
MANVAICCWIAPIQFYAQKKNDLFTEKQLVVKTCLWLSAQVAAIRSGKPLDTGLGFFSIPVCVQIFFYWHRGGRFKEAISACSFF